MQTGQIKKTDWKLYQCVRETGREWLREWGEEVPMRELLQKLSAQNRDVWLIAPDGTKELPEG